MSDDRPSRQMHLVVAAATASLLMAFSAACGSADPVTSDEPFDAERAPLAIAAAGEGRLLVLGGRTPDDGTSPRARNDAGLVDATTGTGTRLPDPPFDLAPTVSTTFTIDDRVLVVGITCPTVDEGEVCTDGTRVAAVLDLTTGDWTELDLPEALDVEPGADAGLWAEHVGVTPGGDAIVEVGRWGDLWLVDPASGEWTELPAPPAPTGASCLAGATLVALDDPTATDLPADPTTPVTSAMPPPSGSTPPSPQPTLRLLTIGDDPTAAADAVWATAPAASPADRPADGLACAGDHVLLLASPAKEQVPTFDTATGTWTTTGSPGLSVWDWNAVTVGDAVTFLEGPVPGRETPGWLYDSTTGSWRSIPQLTVTPSPSGAVWDGEAILGYGLDIASEEPPRPFRYEIPPP